MWVLGDERARRILDGEGSVVLLGEERGSRIGKWSHGGWHVCQYAANNQSMAHQETCCLYT